MQQQFRCEILVDLPIEDVQTGKRLYFSVAELGFDPGLQSGDELTVQDAGFFYARDLTSGRKVRADIQRFNFRARVLKREKVLAVESVEDATDEVISQLRLCIYLEIADKEQIPEIVEAIVGNRSVYRSILPESS